MCGISAALLPARPDACRCYRCLPNRLSRSWGCGRLSECIKVWQTNPLYKGLSFSTSPNFPLLLHTEKRGRLCYYSGESMYDIQTGVCSHRWGETIYGHLSPMFWLRSQLVSTLFSQCSISYKLLIWCGITLMCDPINRRQCVSVALSRLLCHRSRQGRCIHGRATLLIEWPEKWKWKKESTYKCAFGVCHAASEMMNNHDVYWSIWPAVKRIVLCHYII